MNLCLIIFSIIFSLSEISENPPYEWAILASIMGNLSICKVAHDIQNKMVILNDRGLKVKGTLRDPSIAAILMKSYCKDVSTEAFELVLPPITHSDRFALTRQEFSEKNVIFRAVGIMRAMERVELSFFNCFAPKILTTSSSSDSELKNQSFTLFSLIEMPILKCLSHAEHFGFHLDYILFLHYKQLIEDRIKGIDYIVKGQ